MEHIKDIKKFSSTIILEWIIIVLLFILLNYFFNDFKITLLIVFILMILNHYFLLFGLINKQKQRNQYFKRIIKGINKLPNGLVVCDKKGNIRWENKKAKEYSQKNLNTHRIQNISEFFKQTIQLDSLFANENNNKIFTLEIQPELHIEFSVTHLFYDDFFLIYMKDVSDKIFLENSRKIFLGNISHELRIPLTVLKGYIEILENERKGQKYEKADLKPYKNMQLQVDRLLNMVNQLLTLTNIEGNPFFEEKKLVDMPDIIYSIYDEIRVRNDNKQKISLYLDDELFVKGYDRLLRESVSNLIYNAIEHNPKNIEITIRWHKESKNGYVAAMFSIEDNGIGISKEHINRITERFYVVNSARNRGNNKNIGSGLGLAIVKHALKKHDAELIIESEKGKGSCFKFYLPIN